MLELQQRVLREVGADLVLVDLLVLGDELLEALGRGVEPRPSALGRALGLAPWQARFALQGLGRKFGLSLEALLRLARHQVQVAGLQDHLDPPPGREVEPGLHVPGEEEGEGEGALEAPPVGQALGVEAFQ